MNMSFILMLLVIKPNENYMKVISTAIIFLIIATSCSENTNFENALVYNINPTNNDSLSLAVSFTYKSDKEGILLLEYENSSWGDNDIFNCIKDFKVSPNPISIDFDRDNDLITIKTAPNLKSTIHYSIIQDFKGPLLNKYRYRPILDENYFHILGMRLFIIPDGIFETEASKVNIKVNWGDLSNDGIFHSSFGVDKYLDLNVTEEQLDASFFIGGDFRRYEFDYQGNPVYFLTRGNWKIFDDEDIFKILKETITFQNEFWNDPRRGIYSVSLLPTYEPWTATSKSYSVGGSGLPNSFISFASNNEGTTLKRMSWLYNHELLHKWIARTIKNEKEVEQYWFSEGFTDYYAYKLMLQNEKLNAEEFIATLNNEVIIPHYKDTINNIPNSDLTFQKYWSNYAVYEKLPYRRGLLYAFLIDTQIKEQSQYTKSLDFLMRDLLAMALKDENMRLNSLVFKQLLSNYLSDKAQLDFETYIINGQLIDFTGKLPAGLSLEIQNNIPVFIIKPTIDTTQLENNLSF